MLSVVVVSVLPSRGLTVRRWRVGSIGSSAGVGRPRMRQRRGEVQVLGSWKGRHLALSALRPQTPHTDTTYTAAREGCWMAFHVAEMGDHRPRVQVHAPMVDASINASRVMNASPRVVLVCAGRRGDAAAPAAAAERGRISVVERIRRGQKAAEHAGSGLVG